jgi:hypothetical protein
MNRLKPPFIPVQTTRRPQTKPNSFSPASEDLPLEIARIRALHHIHDAAEIITDAMPDVADADVQLYASIASGLRTLERHLAELNQS